MKWDYLSDILILLFISIFIILPLPFFILFIPGLLSYWVIIPFLWGISAGYIMQKGVTSDFIKKGFIIGIIISIFIFVYSYYINQFFLNLASSFTQIMKNLTSENTISHFSFLMKVPEISYLLLSIISSITVFIGILVYSFIFSKLRKK